MLPSLHEPTIVVPVDFDAPSERAVALAIAFARRLSGRLVLLHVVPPTGFPEATLLLPLDASDPVDLGEYVSKRARAMIDEHFVSTLVAGVEVRKEVRTGHVVETILRAADEWHAGLLVVGTHGRKGTDRLLLGSVAEGLVRRSAVPVLVAHGSEDAAAKHVAPFTAAAASSGAVAGAVVGVVGGPVGAAIGGAIGTVAGALAGNAIAKQDAKAEARHRELDQTIGVTSGSLGTPKSTKQPAPETLQEVLDELS